MKEYGLIFQAGLVKGLRATDKNQRNTQALVLSQGMIPEDGALHSLEEKELLAGITALGESFPYPQVFEGQSHLIVFGETKVWEHTGGQFVLQLEGLAAGSLWTVADFYDYMLATNGAVVIRREVETHTWEVVQEEEIPLSQCFGAVNGQLIVGSPFGSDR